jgi:serine/threonine-protein kinase HipA
MFIYKKTQLVGYLSFKQGEYQFVYDKQYLSQNEARALSPDLPLTNTIFTSEKIFTVFEQVIPEGENRKRLERKVKSANDFDLLPYLKDIYGDLQFSKTPLAFDDEDTYQVNYVKVKTEILADNTFPNVLNLEVKIDDEKLFPSHNTNLNTFYPSGLSGFQNKLPVIINNKSIRYPKKNEASVYFLKPYNIYKADPASQFYLPHLAINEHLFMTFAKNELGFDVPYSGIIKKNHDQEYHYLVKRYDRYKGYCFSFDEFANFVGLNSETKYLITSEQMFKTIKKHLTLKKERLVLLKYYFYSMLIVHEDMHSKNLSLLTAEGKRISMAPLYDIATTGIYQGYERETALSIGGKYKNISPNVFCQLVNLLEVSEQRFNKAAADILFQYTYKLPEYFDKLDTLADIMFHKRTKVNLPGKKPKIIESILLSERLKRKHQERIRQLESKGWYKFLIKNWNTF